MNNIRAFISYSWDDDPHKEWVAQLATDLRKDGIVTILDQWHAIPGDQLPAFMEKEIRENEYVLIICTPNYKLKSDHRKGGVGYEGDIMTAEVHTQGNHRKFIPILARGTWKESAPSWLKGKYYVDLSSSEKRDKNYSDLKATILGIRKSAPPVGIPPTSEKPEKRQFLDDEPIKILGVIVDEVTEPIMDGTSGSALYKIPFRLNKEPSYSWKDIFVNTWNRPPRIKPRHRPGIAKVVGAKIILDGTTIEEVRDVHRDTLIICVDVANNKDAEIIEQRMKEKEKHSKRSEDHRRSVEDGAAGLDF